MSILSVQNLTKSYKKGINAVDSLSFEVEKGEIFALIGPNGAGKTTTIRMISTLISPTSGDALVCGNSIVKEPEKVRKNITYLPDEAGAYKTMKGIDYLYFMAGLFFDDRENIELSVKRAVDMCGLGNRLEEKIQGYSRGMIRKLLLSRAVMTRPALAILDEATSGLDVVNALDIRNAIRRLSREEGMSFLLSSHNMLEIEYISDRVGIIAGGHLLEIGTVDDIKRKYDAPNLEEVFRKVNSGQPSAEE
ncbi:MAG: ABC transporter ATP-binding protein [Oscillospiraceae bacterium]|nr:ABC transporter ATP-binding protein [Oscillospiraceae bacterium]MBQ9208077.1 ABC transporter ATP-binding protein [Oscillospiraceae bacterium]MBR4345426.1 ABC transporter ATP-binding protein [Oscillospiraceae bacterium]